MSRKLNSVRLAALIGALSLCLVAIGCGGSDSDADSGGAATTTAEVSNGSADAVTAAQEQVEIGFAGTDRDLPSGGPAAEEAKNVWVISCTQAAEGCQIPSDGLAEAGEELGWNVTVADAALDPAEANKHIRAAAAAGADAIVLVGSVSCDWAPGSLQEAKSRGVAVYGLSAIDCDVNGGEPLFDEQLRYGEGSVPYVEYVRSDLIPALANYITVQTDGQGEIIHLDWDDGGMVREMGESFRENIAEVCPDCTVHQTPYTAADVLQNRLQAKAAAALNRFPDANVVVSTVDGPINLGVGAAVAQATAGGRDILLTGWEGFTTNLEMIAGNGPQNFAVGVPGMWRAWAAADGLNRMFAGEEQVDAGIGYQLIDADHPSPAVPYDGNEKSSGYADNYRSIWSGGQS